MVLGLLDGVPDGYYATQLDAESKIDFIRISRPKNGRYAGTVKIQSQHAERLDTDAVVWSDGTCSIYSTTIIDILMLLVADYRTCTLRYAKEIGHCCRCNTELTDMTSIHYGIGPECVKYWPWVIEVVDEQAEQDA